MNAWKHIPLDLALASGPAGSGGVYLVVRVDRVLDVPTKLEALYVGRTLRPFRRRFREHVDPWRAHSAVLNQTLLMRDLSGLELWLRELAPLEARRAEKLLIRWLRPTLNKIKYESEDNG